VIERSPVGHTLWCTNLLFGPNGALKSRHRKLQPTAAERVVWGQGEAVNPGGDDNMPVVKAWFAKIGGLICWESESYRGLKVSLGHC
jgi:predicted amidohydrolase